MDFTQARTVFLTAPDEARPPTGVPDTPSRRLRDALEPIATVSFWGRPVHERLEALGLDFLTGYVWARTAPMGEPTPPVVVAAFAVFEPGLIAGLYEQGRATAGREAVLAARAEGAAQTLRELLPDDDAAASEAADRLRRATDTLTGDVAGRPLFAGLVSLPWPEDPYGRLWHAASLLREYRGDVHTAANVAAGLTGLQMNLLTEYWIGWGKTEYAGTRGWSPEAMAAADDALVERGLVADGELTAEGRLLRESVEAQTEAALDPALAALQPGLDELIDRLDGWAAAVVAGGAAPPDPFKRVSG